MPWLYILRSSSGRSYIGSTNNIERRFQEHLRGQTPSTRNASWTLVFKQECRSMTEAVQLERKLKRWKSKKIIDRIIHDGFISSR